MERSQPLFHSSVPDRVAAVVYAPAAELENIAQILRTPMLIAVNTFVRRGNAGESNAADFDRTAIVETNGYCWVNPQPVGNKCAIGFRYDEFQA